MERLQSIVVLSVVIVLLAGLVGVANWSDTTSPITGSAVVRSVTKPLDTSWRMVVNDLFVGNTIYNWENNHKRVVKYPGALYHTATVVCAYQAGTNGPVLSYEKKVSPDECKNRESWKPLAESHCLEECTAAVKNQCWFKKVGQYQSC